MQQYPILTSNAELDLLMHRLKCVLFPEVFGRISDSDLYDQLICHIGAAVAAWQNVTPSTPRLDTDVAARQFMALLPTIGELLRSDIDAVTSNDPAVTSSLEVIACYPAFTAMLHYRVAHALHELGISLLPRIITERAHSITGIDIHPAAQIGAAFGIDHGTGVVIGATSIIGTGVMIYQGVTLGAKHFSRDANGNMVDTPRHPIVEDHVTIYSNTSVLGRIRIGHDSVIGGNLWITHDVPPHSHVRQSQPIHHIGFIDGEGI